MCGVLGLATKPDRQFDEATDDFSVSGVADKPAFLGGSVVIFLPARTTFASGKGGIAMVTFGLAVIMAGENGLEIVLIEEDEKLGGVKGPEIKGTHAGFTGGEDDVFPQWKMGKEDERSVAGDFWEFVAHEGKGGIADGGIAPVVAVGGVEAEKMPAAMSEAGVAVPGKEAVVSAAICRCRPVVVTGNGVPGEAECRECGVDAGDLSWFACVGQIAEQEHKGRVGRTEPHG